MCTLCGGSIYPQTRRDVQPRMPRLGYAGDSISHGISNNGQMGPLVGVIGVPISRIAGQFEGRQPGGSWVVAGGTNDAAAGYNPAHLAASVDRVMQAAARNGQRIEYWVGPVKPNPGGVSPRFAHNLEQTNNFLKDYISRKYGVSYVDMHDPRNRVSMSGYHPTGDGYASVRNIIARAPSTTALAQARVPQPVAGPVPGPVASVPALPPSPHKDAAPAPIPSYRPVPVAAAPVMPSHYFYQPRAA